MTREAMRSQAGRSILIMALGLLVMCLGLAGCDGGVVGMCTTVDDCADVDGNGLRDDPCTWWACTAGGCQGIDTVFADVGGEFGSCTADGTADANDRFHALNCFSNTDTGGATPYPCETAAPAAYNVDAGGEFGDCNPDGICDGNDAFHTINAFDGTSTCTCPGGGAPQPDQMPYFHRTTCC